LTAHLHIGRLVITGLPPETSAEALRPEIERHLERLLTPAMIAGLDHTPRLSAPIDLLAPPGDRALAFAVALAIRTQLCGPGDAA
jgi:hypothetical protein